jgi:hypothetical protein
MRRKRIVFYVGEFCLWGGFHTHLPRKEGGVDSHERSLCLPYDFVISKHYTWCTQCTKKLKIMNPTFVGLEKINKNCYIKLFV